MKHFKALSNISHHPALTGKYRIPTASILTLMDAIMEWINNRSPGGIVVGLQRYGKSSAIEYITNNLPDQLGRAVSVCSFECKKHQRPNENRFYEDMLLQIKHKLPSSGSASRRRARLVEYIIEKTDIDDGHLVIILDESQKMDLIYYEYLADFHNDIVKAGYSPLFVLVGQPELLNMRSSLRLAKKGQIIGRFMLREHFFHGLTNLDAIRAALQAYDEQTEYPEKSKCSYSRFFFPDAFEAGWRLSNEAARIKECFDSSRVEHALIISEDIPMQYFCTAIENFFRKYHEADTPEFKGTTTIWKKLISESGYLAAGAEMHEMDEKEAIHA